MACAPSPSRTHSPAESASPCPRRRFPRSNARSRTTASTRRLPTATSPAKSQPLSANSAAILAEDDSGFLDIDGAAAFLGGCSRKRIYNLVERAGLPHYKAGGRLLFDPAQLRAWVEACR